MSEITKLLQKKDSLLIQIACLENDINEYINHPVETVSIQQLHYQYDFIIQEILDIDTIINIKFSNQRLSLNLQNSYLKKLTNKATSSIVFTINDVPKIHFSMFEDLNSI